MLPGVFILVLFALFMPQFQSVDLSGGAAGIGETYPITIAEETHDEFSETPEIYIPDFETSLKPLERLNRKHRILYPEDASSYIMPDNDVVQWFAAHTVLTDEALLWKHNGSNVVFTYQSDNELFENPPDGDMWQNPDYYLTNGNIGDCEDFSMAFASILEAQGIPAQVVGVDLINGNKHWVVKYYFNEQENFADINRNGVIIYHGSNPTIDEALVSIDQQSITILIK